MKLQSRWFLRTFAGLLWCTILVLMLGQTQQPPTGVGRTGSPVAGQGAYWSGPSQITGSTGLTLGSTDTLSWHPRVTTMNADKTLTVADGPIIACTAGATNKTATLPVHATTTQGWIRLVKVDSGAGACVLAPSGSDTLNLVVGSQAAAVRWDFVDAYKDASGSNNWHTYSGLVLDLAPSKLWGRGDTGTGPPQPITLGTGLSMSLGGTVLNATGSSVTFATRAETTTGTSTTTAVNPDGLAHSVYAERFLTVECIADATDLTSGDGKCFLPIHADLAGFKVVSATFYLGSVLGSTATTIDADICAAVTSGIRCSGATRDLFSTNAVIDANEMRTTTGTAPTITTANGGADATVAADEFIQINVDIVGTGAKGLYGTIALQRP